MRREVGDNGAEEGVSFLDEISNGPGQGADRNLLTHGGADRGRRAARSVRGGGGRRKGVARVRPSNVPGGVCGVIWTGDFRSD